MSHVPCSMFHVPCCYSVRCGTWWTKGSRAGGLVECRKAKIWRTPWRGCLRTAVQVSTQSGRTSSPCFRRASCRSERAWYLPHVLLFTAAVCWLSCCLVLFVVFLFAPHPVFDRRGVSLRRLCLGLRKRVPPATAVVGKTEWGQYSGVQRQHDGTMKVERVRKEAGDCLNSNRHF